MRNLIGAICAICGTTAHRHSPFITPHSSLIIREATLLFVTEMVFESVDSALSYNNIGVILATRGDLGAAERAFQIAITISHDRLPEAKRNLEFCRSASAARQLIGSNGFELAMRTRLELA